MSITNAVVSRYVQGYSPEMTEKMIAAMSRSELENEVRILRAALQRLEGEMTATDIQRAERDRDPALGQVPVSAGRQRNVPGASGGVGAAYSVFDQDPLDGATEDTPRVEEPIGKLWKYMPSDEQLQATARRIVDTLDGHLAPSKLNRVEHAIWIELFSREMGRPGPDEEAYFADRRRRGVGVGLDEEGNRTRAYPDGGSEIIMTREELERTKNSEK